MPRTMQRIAVDLLPIETVDAEHPCPWIRATEVLIKAAERLGISLDAGSNDSALAIPSERTTTTGTLKVAI